MKIKGRSYEVHSVRSGLRVKLCLHGSRSTRGSISARSYRIHRISRGAISRRASQTFMPIHLGEGGKKGKSKSHLSQYINSIFSSRLSISIDSREIELIGRIDDSRSCERDENVALWSSRESCVFRNSYLTRDISLTLIIHMRYLILLNLSVFTYKYSR